MIASCRAEKSTDRLKDRAVASVVETGRDLFDAPSGPSGRTPRLSIESNVLS
jgi:hypothetical protein